MGWAVYRAEKSQPLAGHGGAGGIAALDGSSGESMRSRILDGNRVAGITPSLDPPVEGARQSIPAGCERRAVLPRLDMFSGRASFWSQRRRRRLIAKDPRNKAVLFPVPQWRGSQLSLGLLSKPLGHQLPRLAHRDERKQYPDVFAIVDEKVKPIATLRQSYVRGTAASAGGSTRDQRPDSATRPSPTSTASS